MSGDNNNDYYYACTGHVTFDCAYHEYYIIGGLVGGILLVTMVILFTFVICGKLRHERRKKLQGNSEIVKFNIH